MATGGAESDECPFCLQTFTNPTFLTCQHTLCARCINTLAYDGKSLFCPVCRESTVLPPGGVESMKINLNINEWEQCQIHKGQVFKYYCNPCDQAICLDCKLTSHESHETLDLRRAAEDVKPRLREDQTHVRLATNAVVEKVDAIKTQQKEQETTQKEMEAEINRRHSALLATADRLKAEALDSLRATCKSITTDIVSSLQQREKDLSVLLDIHELLEKALTTDPDSKVMYEARQMEKGYGSVQALNRMTSRPDEEFDRPVQHNTSTLTDMEIAARAFLGPVMASKLLEADVTVTKRFKCGGGPETSVFSLCHLEGDLDGDPPVLWVTFDQQVPMKKFLENGKLLKEDERVGQVSNRRCGHGLNMSTRPRTDGGIRTCSKSSLVPHYVLDNDGSGQATLKKLRFISFGNTYDNDIVEEILINVGLHRALDVSADETFVVVEELQPPNVARKVLMYRRPGGDPVTTYTPPTPTFQPSDVCFYKLGGQQVLLVSDEAADEIHVVSVGEDTLTFQRFLTRNCSLLVCPTAMCVDVGGRLWVACKGGRLLTIEPKTPSKARAAIHFPFTRSVSSP